MKKFTDAEGREWILSLNVGLIESVRELDVDLADMTSRTFFRLADDPVTLVAVLWRLIEEQAKKNGVSPAEFGEGLVGDAIDDATAALLQATTDFFPRRKRELFRRVIELGKAAMVDADRLAADSLDDPATRQKISRAMKAAQDAEMQRALSQLESATSWPDSSESTPDPSPGDS